MKITPKFIITCLSYLFIFQTFQLTAQEQTKIGTWQTHLSYVAAKAITQTNDKIFVGTERAIFSYDKEDFSLQRHSTTEGLNDLNIRQLAFDSLSNTLIIAYQNANIDLWKENRIINIPAIEQATVVGNKQINHIHIVDNLAYLSCGFAIIVLDIEKEEIKDTYRIGEGGTDLAIYQITTTPTLLVAATERGILYADRNNPNLSNFNSWQRMNNLPFGTTKQVAFLNSTLYTSVNNNLFAFDGENWTAIHDLGTWCIKYMTAINDRLALVTWKNDCDVPSTTRLTFVDNNNQVTHQEVANMFRPQQIIADKDNNLWVADLWQGLGKITNNTMESIFPNGPRSNLVANMAISNSKLWVAPGGVGGNWNYKTFKEGFFMYENGIWENIHQYNTPALTDINDLVPIALHPTQNKVFFGSVGRGLIEYNQEEGIKQYTEETSLQTAVGDPGSYRVTGLAFDQSNNLWVANWGSLSPISVKTPENEWMAFKPPFPILTDKSVHHMLIDDFGQKWTIIHDNGLIVFNHGQDLFDTSDDTYKQLTKGENSGNLPSNAVLSIAKDRDGAIWVGTNQGVVVFYCPNTVIQNGCPGVLPYIEVDGEGANLLANDVIQAIAVDGANRKWFGTTNGVWLISPDGSQAISHFTTQNSPLLSNNIVSLTIDPQTGEVFMGTDKGIISFKSDATGATPFHENVIVYPNPVRPNYTGEIAIKGLAQDANVKITDITGTLIYETQALGGQAIWDGKNFDGRKASSGVYLILSTNQNGTDSIVTKLMIIN